MTRILTALIVILLWSVPAYAQTWTTELPPNGFNGWLQARSGPANPLVVIDQTNTTANGKIVSFRAAGTEKCYIDIDGDLVCQGSFTFVNLTITGQAIGPLDTDCSAPAFSGLGKLTTGFAVRTAPSAVICVNGSVIVTSTASAVTSTVPLSVSANGTVTDPALALGSDGDGFYRAASSAVGISLNNDVRMAFDGSGTTYNLNLLTSQLVWGTGLGNSYDLSLSRLAADTLGLRRGTNDQQLSIGPSGSTLVLFKANNGDAIIAVEDNKQLLFRSNNLTRWNLDTSGNFLAAGAYNIGDGAGNSPAVIEAETDIQINNVSVAVAVGAGYKIARGSTALDGSNPTTVATGLTTVVSCTGTLLRNSAVTSGSAFLTHDTASGANVDWYAWILAGTASAGTETFEWICVGT